MIRLFVGADGTNCDLESQSVLEWSVRKYASEDVSITWMQQAATGPWSGWKCGTGRTPFSHFRWSPPALCNYEGRAAYCDSDFVFMADIAELWRQPIPGVLLSKSSKHGGLGKSCCMLFDCAAARGHIPSLQTLRRMSDPQSVMTNYFRANPDLCSRFEGDWNCRDHKDLKGYDGINDLRIKAIHYTDMNRQVHLKHAIPRLRAEGRRHWYEEGGGTVSAHDRADLQGLFDSLLEEATANGYGVERYRVTPYAQATRREYVYQGGAR